MRRPARTLLLGGFAATALSALVAAGWFLLAPEPIESAVEALPLPPESPRLAEGPEMERCLELLRADPEEARVFAAAWAEQEGGEGARHCGALAMLAAGEASGAAERLEAIASQSYAGSAARAAVFAQATQAWLLAGRPDRARDSATLALTLAPEDPDLLIDRAVALGNLRRYAEAVTDLDHALRLEPGRVEALVFRAAAWRHLDRADPARRDVERALEIAPDSAEALLERGILRQLAGDTEGARMDWERLIEIAPNSAAADLALQNLALNEAGPSQP
jgi:tetratricopeptide (TPR) repeat protein